MHSCSLIFERKRKTTVKMNNFPVSMPLMPNKRLICFLNIRSSCISEVLGRSNVGNIRGFSAQKMYPRLCNLCIPCTITLYRNVIGKEIFEINSHQNVAGSVRIEGSYLNELDSIELHYSVMSLITSLSHSRLIVAESRDSHALINCSVKWMMCFFSILSLGETSA